MTEKLPFVIRPITYDIPETDQKNYSRREEREIGGVKYYFYYMDDDKAFTDYMAALTERGMVHDCEITPRRRFSFADSRISTDFFKCHCRVCTSPPEYEAFYKAKDYKVVEGIRKVACLGVLGRFEAASGHAAEIMLANMTPLHERLSASLAKVREKGEQTAPAPYLNHVYTVGGDHG